MRLCGPWPEVGGLNALDQGLFELKQAGELRVEVGGSH